MSYRSDAFSKEFLLLNVPDSSIHFPQEENIIAEYKRLFNEKKTLEKELDIILYIKKKGLFTSVKTKVLRRKLDKMQGQLHFIEESSVRRPLIEREQERRENEQQEKELAFEAQKAKEAEQVFAVSPFVAHDDDYYDSLWRSDYNEFWKQVKLEWRANNPGKTTTESGIPFEKSCEHLSWQLGHASKSLTIAQMREKIPYNRNKPNPCVYDVIREYIYYYPICK